MTAGWINNALAALPGTDDTLFYNLWVKRRLLFDKQHGSADMADECCARLVVAALRQRGRLIIVLPDYQPHRPAFLFASALIRYWLDSCAQMTTSATPPDNVLYFGSAIGIREHLRRTSVTGLQMNLSDVFEQQDFSRGAMGSIRAGPSASARGSRMPQVATVYAPADPVSILHAYKPRWIAIDCGDSPSLLWLRPLLDEVSRRDIPVIAWGQNPLSECIKDFLSDGEAFIWQPRIHPPSCHPIKMEGDPAALLNTENTTSLVPVVLEGRSVSSFSAHLHEANHLLYRTIQHAQGELARDAVRIHWKYLRSLETLATPLDFYEAEAARFWGMQGFGRISTACEHFRNNCERGFRELYAELEKVAMLLHEAHRDLESNGCALWNALGHLCIEDIPDDEARVITFHGEGKKRLFQFALLARHNITDEDLQELHIYITSLKEIRRWMHYRDMSFKRANTPELLMPPDTLSWHPVLVGIPNPIMIPQLLPVFLHKKVDILLYPHQRAAFTRKQNEWTGDMTANGDRIFKTLAKLGNLTAPAVKGPRPTRIAVVDAVEMNTDTAAKTDGSLAGPLWKPDDTVSEVTRLFQSEDESDEEDVPLADHTEGRSVSDSSEDIWCTEAIRVQFEHGWVVNFAPDDLINVVKAVSHVSALEQRYVRALRVGERVLLIHGQQRQSLYDLIISRVHKHPSIELHVAMIRRWQEDFRMAFEQWRSKGGVASTEYRDVGTRDLNGLLRRMRELGSTLSSPEAIYWWLKGLVLCPRDEEDLSRLSDVLGMRFVNQYYKNIAHAANRLRGLHISLSLKLSHWLEDHASGSVNGRDNDVIDAELSLTFGDMRNSLLVLRVIAVQNISGPFLRCSLGHIERN
ncbi:MAG: hypothetical protein ABR911_14210 [Syntrophales bacterium]